MFSVSGFSQDLFKGNLANFKADNMSDSAMLQYKAQLTSKGISLADAEQQAIARGMQMSELMKLRERISKLSTPQQQGSDNARQSEKDNYKAIPQQPTSKVFGSSFFSTTSLSFEPNLRIATPSSYIVGPDDELIISVTGLQEAGFKVKVAAGRIDYDSSGWSNQCKWTFY